MTYYKEKHRIFQNECSDDNPSPCVNISQVPVQKKETNVSGMIKSIILYLYYMLLCDFFQNQAEKFRYVSKLTTSLASLASESTGSIFTSRCDLLKKFYQPEKVVKSVTYKMMVVSQN